MPEREQWSITLDDYHQWAVERIADAMHRKRTELVEQAVHEWVLKYPDAVASARATLADFVQSPQGRQGSKEGLTKRAKGRHTPRPR